MSYTETHKIVLRKYSVRALNGDAVERNIATIKASVNTQQLSVRGWRFTEDRNEGTGQALLVDQAIDNPDAKFINFLDFVATFERRDDKKPDSQELASIVTRFAKKASAPTSGLWEVLTVDGQPFKPIADEDDNLSANVGYADVVLPDDFSERFSHLFGVGPHVMRLRLAIEAGVDSEWANRLHCVLVGAPGCGKSDICSTLKEILGIDAVMAIDCTATTSAGIIQDLTEAPMLPRIIVAEEIEKAPEDAMRVLLGMMDSRGEIRKLTARGKIQRDTRVLVIATVNNLTKFNRMNEGALSSRFSNRIHFKRPARDVLAMILHREISKIGGSDEWITPVLDYCDKMRIVDPRRVITLALTGKGYWLTGEYQAMLDATDETVMDDDE